MLSDNVCELSKQKKIPCSIFTINYHLYFQQWKEKGKTKNRCISEEEATILRPQIEKRKQLQKELKALKKTMPLLGSKTRTE